MQATFKLYNRGRWKRFFWSENNALVRAWCEQWQAHCEPRSHNQAYIFGEQGSGKSQLAAMLAWKITDVCMLDGRVLDSLTLLSSTPTTRIIFDNIDALCGDQDREQQLFHQLNSWQEQGYQLLVTARSPASTLPWHIADVRTRLEQLLPLKLEPLDDATLRAALEAFAKMQGWEDAHAAIGHLLKKFPGQVAKMFLLIEQIIADFPVSTAMNTHSLTRYVETLV